MFWFIPTTHKIVIVALLVIALVALVLFFVTRVAARRRGRRAQVQVVALAGVQHRSGRSKSPGE